METGVPGQAAAERVILPDRIVKKGRNIAASKASTGVHELSHDLYKHGTEEKQFGRTVEAAMVHLRPYIDKLENDLALAYARTEENLANGTLDKGVGAAVRLYDEAMGRPASQATFFAERLAAKENHDPESVKRELVDAYDQAWSQLFPGEKVPKTYPEGSRSE